MTRYFLSAQDAGTVICALAESGVMPATDLHGVTFVPKMPCVNLKTMIDALAPEVRQNKIGRRKGEKLHEDLLFEHEFEYAFNYKLGHIPGYRVGKAKTGGINPIGRDVLSLEATKALFKQEDR